MCICGDDCGGDANYLVEDHAHPQLNEIVLDCSVELRCYLGIGWGARDVDGQSSSIGAGSSETRKPVGETGGGGSGACFPH